MNLIYCASGNRRFAQIAIDTGYLYGAQLPRTIYHPPYFVDQDWKKPDRDNYINAIAKWKPYIASVLDWEYPEQENEVLGWAYDIAPFVTEIIIIPKADNIINKIPLYILGKRVRLGFSVPTAYGGTNLMVSEFDGWEVHLLGGSPGAQMYLSQYLNVVSADGNMHHKLANRGLFWERGKGLYSNRWVSLKQADGKRWNGNGHYEAFRRSCINIREYWEAA